MICGGFTGWLEITVRAIFFLLQASRITDHERRRLTVKRKCFDDKSYDGMVVAMARDRDERAQRDNTLRGEREGVLTLLRPSRENMYVYWRKTGAGAPVSQGS